MVPVCRRVVMRFGWLDPLLVDVHLIKRCYSRIFGFSRILTVKLSHEFHRALDILPWFPGHLLWGVSFPFYEVSNFIPYFPRVGDVFDLVLVMVVNDLGGWRTLLSARKG